MRQTVFFILLSFFLLSQVGCSVQPSVVVMVDGDSLENKASKAQTPFDKPAYSRNILDGSFNCTGQARKCTEHPANWRVKYYSPSGQNHWSVVEGVLHSGKTYPVILDTGASAAVFVNDIHIRENNLTFYPFKRNDDEWANWGICDLDGLRIGEMSLSGWPCYYQQRHAEVRLFGLPIFRDKTIVVGLPILRQFKYIEFDNVRREVYFSLDSPFEPSEPDSWMHYSFVIEEYSQNNTVLLVDIPVAGEQIQLQLDTGSNGGLAVSKEIWNRINKKLQDVKLVESEDLYPYIGRVACERVVIPNIEVGDRTIENIRLSVFSDDSKIIENSQGLLGMQCFQDTVMVIDFEKSLIWLKNAGCSKINSVIL